MWNGFQDWEDVMIPSFSATYSRVPHIQGFGEALGGGPGAEEPSKEQRGHKICCNKGTEPRVFGSSDMDFSINLSHNLTQVFSTLTNFHVFVDQTWSFFRALSLSFHWTEFRHMITHRLHVLGNGI